MDGDWEEYEPQDTATPDPYEVLDRVYGEGWCERLQILAKGREYGTEETDSN